MLTEHHKALAGKIWGIANRLRGPYRPPQYRLGADQLFFDQVRATAEENEQVVEAVQANNFANFSAYFERILEGLFIDRMDGNEEIFRRVMSDKQFRDIAQAHLARELYGRIREGRSESPDPTDRA